jgi:hypothetical protein
MVMTEKNLLKLDMVKQYKLSTEPVSLEDIDAVTIPSGLLVSTSLCRT